MTQETELLPCPFCGPAPIPHKYLPDRVACQNTGCWICKTYIAIDDWNTRSRLGKVESKPVEVGELMDTIQPHAYTRDIAQAILSRYNVTKKEEV